MRYDSYHSYEFRYKCGRSTYLIYARREEIADKIMAVESACSPWLYKRARFHFKKATLVKVPPYELEQQELETAIRKLEHRKEYFRTHEEEATFYGIPKEEYQ